MRNSRSLLVFLAATLALGLGGWALVYFLRPVAVVAPAVRGKAINAVPGSVTVSSERQVQLKSELGGRVARSALSAGRKFAEGEFMVQIDDTDLRLEIERIESEYQAHQQRLAVGSSIQLELETAREEFANKERLFKLGNFSEAELNKQQRVVRQIEQRLELERVENQLKSSVFENTLKVKRRQLGKMFITAPVEGVVSVVHANPGDLIAADTPIADFIASNRQVEAKISEENFAGVKIGQKASVRFLGYGAQLYGASVIKVLPTADPQSQRYIVHLQVDIPVERLVPGLTGEVSIVIGEREAETIVPRRALRGNELFVVQGGVIQLRKVQVGYIGLNQVEVLDGLRPGEMVVVDELERYRPGDRVRTLLSVP